MKIMNVLNSKAVVIFDWVLALSTCMYGLFLMYDNYSSVWPYILLCSGFVGCALAYYRPVNILKNTIKKQLTGS